MKDDVIRPGDLVMIIKPSTCCGSSKRLGKVFTAGEVSGGAWRCSGCGAWDDSVTVNHPPNDWVELSRLKKINPPEHGDELPTRANLNQPVGV